MGPIVCVTRGGEASLRTQERAIQLACERGAALIFLFVADPGFARPVDEKLAAALADELEHLVPASTKWTPMWLSVTDRHGRRSRTSCVR
jgi:hypothetical protein